jgi:hypothetical protein
MSVPGRNPMVGQFPSLVSRHCHPPLLPAQLAKREPLAFGFIAQLLVRQLIEHVVLGRFHLSGLRVNQALGLFSLAATLLFP